MNRLNDYVFEKQSRNGVKDTSTIRLSQLKGPFITQCFITLSKLSRQVNVTSLALEWRSCNHARPFSFVPTLSFTKLEHFGLHLLRSHNHSDFGK